MWFFLAKSAKKRETTCSERYRTVILGYFTERILPAFCTLAAPSKKPCPPNSHRGLSSGYAARIISQYLLHLFSAFRHVIRCINYVKYSGSLMYTRSHNVNKRHLHDGCTVSVHRNAKPTSIFPKLVVIIS